MKTSAKASILPKRPTERLSIPLPVSIRIPGHKGGGNEQTSTLNLSRGGVSFTGTRRYSPGMNLRVTFQGCTDLSGKVREIPAKVIRVSRFPRSDASVVGARFEDTGLASMVLSELLRVQMRISLALLDVINALSSGAKVAEVIESICQATGQAMEAERALLFLPEGEQAVLFSQTRDNKHREVFQIRPDKGLLGKAAASSQVTNVEAPSEDSLFRPELDQALDRKTRSDLCVPL